MKIEAEIPDDILASCVDSGCGLKEGYRIIQAKDGFMNRVN